MKQFIIFNGDVPTGTTVNIDVAIDATQGELKPETIHDMAVCESFCEVGMGGHFTIVRIK